ncbi:gamma-glutamylcyclotransferase family protein [Thermocrinis sp.]|uniref:gamma-glutamylcyclotransferase family protein n=1 Tax=Thermocrinis sp. TaxID=2024383 RepID=UPI002FDDF95A
MVLYFAYGSNMNLKQMRERCGDSWKKIGVGYVEGYKLVFDGPSSKWNGGVANLVQDPTGRVWGVLFELESFECLDLHEGYPGVYDRKEVSVVVPELGQVLKAVAYVRPKPREIRKPSERYLNTVIEGAKENSLPEDWIKFLESHR